ncbi:MAG: prepilin-type cleavage/methylation domain-containing protein [Methylophilaceae bacterium]
MMNTKLKIKPKIQQQQGVVLLEALIAILIFSFGILALAGLQAAMIKNTTDSKFRSDAANVAQRQLGIIWANPTNIANYTGTTNVADLPNGSMTVAQPTAGRVTVQVSWQQPGEAQHKYDANAYVITGCPTCP